MLYSHSETRKRRTTITKYEWQGNNKSLNTPKGWSEAIRPWSTGNDYGQKKYGKCQTKVDTKIHKQLNIDQTRPTKTLLDPFFEHKIYLMGILSTINSGSHVFFGTTYIYNSRMRLFWLFVLKRANEDEKAIMRNIDVEVGTLDLKEKCRSYYTKQRSNHTNHLNFHFAFSLSLVFALMFRLFLSFAV